MSKSAALDRWSAGDSYELYMGRWSRLLAHRFLDWTAPPPGGNWLDVGCGTGALTTAVLQHATPDSVLGIDPSDGFVAHATAKTEDPRARFAVAGATDLPCDSNSIDVTVSALALNFVPDRPAALAEMQRVTRPGGIISLYIWDYPGGGMGFIDAFWRAATRLNPKAGEFDEAGRFRFCTAEGMHDDFAQAGLLPVTVEPIEIRTVFPDFDAFWHPFTLGAGPAPGYLAALDDADAAALKAALSSDLGSGAIDLPARAWAARVLAT